MTAHDPIIDSQVPRADFTIDQVWDAYTDEEHRLWRRLYNRQSKIVKDMAAPEFLKGLEALDLNRNGIPEFAKINPKLKALTGWEVVAVPELVPDDIFFDHLANRRFPAGRFIRKPEQIDYIQEPDIFHDVYGHVPMLTNPIFADYMQAYGQGGLRSLKYDCLKNLARLYWYTVEFGLVKTEDGVKIYGAGILSSNSECDFALNAPSPNRLQFDLERLMLTDYIIDDFQQSYFIIDSMQHLLDATQQDFDGIYKRLHDEHRVHPVDAVLHTDIVYHTGTQDYARGGGRQAV